MAIATAQSPALGAEVTPGGVQVRVWAPRAGRVTLVVEGGAPRAEISMTAEPDGHWSAPIPHAGAGTLYRFRLDDRPDLLADPASRFQPEGPMGPSQVVDPRDFGWTDSAWTGPLPRGQVLYELHVGTFTPEGTWTAAAQHLPELAELGVTLVELMPVAEQPGRFGWGYDGVGQYAPYHIYGTPDDFRRFVDQAHGLGLGVLLDVVYNHFGPTGNLLPQFADCYFSKQHKTEWGEALNFDGEGRGPVRRFIAENAAMWAAEYHLDGLRLDATQAFFDRSRPHILTEIADRMRAEAAAAGRRVLILGENEPQHMQLARPASARGIGLDGLWSDDFHHTARVLATGRREAYYADYQGTAAEVAALLRHGWLYQGQHHARQGKRRGSVPTGLRPWQFVNYLQNHDQVANSLRGDRLHRETDPATLRTLTALLLLGPGTPLLFMGQEFAASTPFLYFGDQPPDVAAQMHLGRRDFLKQFASLALPEVADGLTHPAEPGTRARCVLDHAERTRPGHAEVLALHRDLLRLRREDPVLAAQGEGGVHTAVLAELAVAVRLADAAGAERLLVLNFGPQRRLTPVTEPLLAPTGPGRDWSLLWSSEDPRYGGHGTPPPVGPDGWQLPARSALLLMPADSHEGSTDDAAQP